MSGDLNGRRVLVTGADGFIGSHVLDALLDAGAQVTALAQYTSFGTAGWLDRLDLARRAAVDIRHGDVRDSGYIRDLVAGHDVVMHLAALIAIPFSYVAPRSYIDVNILGTLNLLEACRRHATPRLIHTSTSEVYGTARYTPIDEAHPLQGQSPYSASKIGADHLVESFVRSFDVPAVILRPFNTFGPRQSERAVIPTIIRQALDPDCDAIRLGALTVVRDFNYVRDTARAFCLAATADSLEPGVPYNVATGVAVTVGDVVDRVRCFADSDKPVLHDAKRERPAKSEVVELLGDSQRFRAATGWSPTIGLDDGLQETIVWWRDEIARQAVRVGADYAV